MGIADPILIPVPISNIKCAAPVLKLKDQRKSYNQPFKFFRKDPVRVISQMLISCDVSFRNRKSWNVEKVNPKTGEIITRINLGEKYAMDSSEFYVDEHVLAYGLYKFTYTVVIEVSDPSVKPPIAPFRNTEYTYIEITTSKLRPRLTKGVETFIQVPNGEVITLSPSKWSLDPDLPRDVDQVSRICDILIVTRNVFDFKCDKIISSNVRSMK